MEFYQYQVATRLTRQYPEESKIVYPALGVAGEAGEIAEKVKKYLRGDNPDQTAHDLAIAVSKEIGDQLWYLAALCDDLGLDFGRVAEQNLQKLADRRERGVIKGSGDDR